MTDGNSRSQQESAEPQAGQPSGDVERARSWMYASVVLMGLCLWRLGDHAFDSFRQDEPTATEFQLVLDINKATTAQLIALPEIGPSLAKRIVQDRATNGDFQSTEELQRVRGIGPATLRAIKPLLTVSTGDGLNR